MNLQIKDIPMTIDDIKALIASDESNSFQVYNQYRIRHGIPFPDEITPENIKEPHDSDPYNVKMTEALYRSMWLENWGSGAKRIIEACQEQGVEEPTWRWDGGFVYVTFKRPTKYDPSTAQVATKQEDEPLNHRSTTDQVFPNVAPGTTESTTEDSKSTTESTIETLMSSIEFNNGNSEHKIMGLLKLDGSLTIDQLYPLLKMSRKGVQKAIERLKDKGILYREGSTKGGRWIVSQKS